MYVRTMCRSDGTLRRYIHKGRLQTFGREVLRTLKLLVDLLAAQKQKWDHGYPTLLAKM
jgi:hypothetical protein